MQQQLRQQKWRWIYAIAGVTNHTKCIYLEVSCTLIFLILILICWLKHKWVYMSIRRGSTSGHRFVALDYTISYYLSSSDLSFLFRSIEQLWWQTI
jgi:hypothetical protein